MEKSTIIKMFNTLEDSCKPHDKVGFDWSAKGIGFGQIYFYLDKTDGHIHCDNEYMSRKFLKETLCKMIDNCILNDPNDQAEDTGTNGYPSNYHPQITEDDNKDLS